MPTALPVGTAPSEEREHRDRGHREQQKHAQRADVGEPGEQGGHRVLAQQGEHQHDDRRERGLGQRAHVRGPVPGVGPAQCHRQHAFPAQREEVARHRVVERQQGGEQAGHQEDLREVGERPAQGVLGEGEHQRGALRASPVHDRAHARTRDHRPGREAVEHPDQAHRRVGRTGHGAARVAALLAVDRGRLEPGEGAHREAGRGAERAPGQRAPAERRQRHRLWGRRELAQVEHQHRRRLQRQQHGQHLRVEVDPQVTQHAHQQHAAQHQRPPRHCQPQLALQQVRGGEAEQAVDADLHCVVGQQCDERGAHSGSAAKSVADVGVEGARADDPSAHRRVARAEHGQQACQHQEQQWHAQCGRDAEGLRDAASSHGQRCGGGDDEEDDVRYAQTGGPRGGGTSCHGGAPVVRVHTTSPIVRTRTTSDKGLTPGVGRAPRWR